MKSPVQYTADLLPLLIEHACEPYLTAHQAANDRIFVDVQDLPKSILREGAVLLLRGELYNEQQALERIAEIRGQFPATVILLLVKWDQIARFRLHRYIRSGIDDVITVGPGEKLERSLKYIAFRRRARPPRPELELLHHQFTVSAAMVAVTHGFRNGAVHLRAPQLALRLGYSQRTLRENLADAGMPCPRDLCRCGWFLTLAEFNTRRTVSTEVAACQLGFADATDLRKKKAQLRASITADERLRAFATLFPRLTKILEPARSVAVK